MYLGCRLTTAMVLTVSTQRIESSEPLGEHSPLVVIIPTALAMSLWLAVFARWTFDLCTA